MAHRNETAPRERTSNCSSNSICVCVLSSIYKRVCTAAAASEAIVHVSLHAAAMLLVVPCGRQSSSAVHAGSAVATAATTPDRTSLLVRRRDRLLAL